MVMEIENTSGIDEVSNEVLISVVDWIVGEHMCKVSIIMPVYNKEKYIEKAVQSVLQQTLQDWELLIIDDGSTDSSLQKCQSFHDERIKVVHVENGGVSRARNIGLDMAKGEYVTFVDGDDYLAKDYLQELYVPGNEIILGGLTKVNLSGVFLGAVLPKLKGRKSIQEVAKTFYEEQLASGIYGFVASKMIRRDVIEKNRLRFDERIRLAEDYEFFLKVYDQVSGILFSENAGYYYVQETENSGIAIDDTKTDFWIQIEIQDKTKAFLKKHKCFGENEKETYLKRVTGYVYTILLLNQNVKYADFELLYKKLKTYVPVVSNDMKGISKMYIFCYKENWNILLYALLKLRKLVRKL